MPLFVCDHCQAIESTATSTFSRQINARAAGERKHLLCSECESGRWHGVFRKQIATPRFVREHRHNFIYTGALTR